MGELLQIQTRSPHLLSLRKENQESRECFNLGPSPNLPNQGRRLDQRNPKINRSVRCQHTTSSLEMNVLTFSLVSQTKTKMMTTTTMMIMTMDWMDLKKDWEKEKAPTSREDWLR